MVKGTLPAAVSSTSIKGRIALDRVRFMSNARRRVPLPEIGFNFNTDQKNPAENSLADRIAPLPGATYAGSKPGVAGISISTPVDFNPANDSADRPVQVQSAAPKVVDTGAETDQSNAHISFSPLRFPVWRSKKGVPFNDIAGDLQGAFDKQIPKGKYVFTFRMTPDPAGEYIGFADGFTFSVDGKVQILEKAEIDTKAGLVRLQVTVKENLVWLIPLGIAGAAALGWMFSEADDVLVQVDRILLDSWVPVAAAGAALALYLIWKRSK